MIIIIIIRHLSITDICDGCTIVNGVGYKAHWSDCTKFIQCSFNPNGATTVYIKSCKHGTFWDQKTLTCNLPHLVDCPYGKQSLHIMCE